jgi:hypothetical protein
MPTSRWPRDDLAAIGIPFDLSMMSIQAGAGEA